MQLRRITAVAIVAVAVGSGASAAFAGPDGPPNDDFVNAIGLTLGSPTSGYTSNAGATKEAGEPNHAGKVGGASLWYRFELPVDAPISVDTCLADFDTLLAVYTGSTVSTLTPIASNDDNPSCATGSNRVSKVVFNAKAHRPYAVAVDGFNGATGHFFVAIDIANDFWQHRQVVGPIPVSSAGTNVSADDWAGEPHPPRGGGAVVWYSYTPGVSGPVALNTCHSDFDTVVAVYTGNDVHALHLVTSNDDGGAGACPSHGSGSAVTFNGFAGIEYSIGVDGYLSSTTGTATGNFVLAIGAPPSPPTITGVTAGDGWATIAFHPNGQGGAPFTSFWAVAVPAVKTASEPGSARRITLSGLTNGQTNTAEVLAYNSFGASFASSASATFTPNAGPATFTTKYSSTDATRLAKTAKYLNTSTSSAQLQSIGVVAYLLGLSHPAPSPVTPPNVTSGPTSVTTTYIAGGQSPLVTVMNQYALTPQEAQSFATSLVGFLLALGGH